MTTTGVLGLGYVGIPLAASLSKTSNKVIGFDILEERVEQLNHGRSPIQHITNDMIAAMINEGFRATNDFSKTADCDNLVICVPTPLNKHREPDLSFVKQTMDSISPYLRKGQMISLESTTWPGTTNEILLPYIEAAGLDVGTDFNLIYSPEREDPGNKNFSTSSIPKIVGGHTKSCLERGLAFYSEFIDTVVPVSSTQAAEMVKLLENIHRSVNIGLVNEMKLVADAMGLDIFEIIKAAATKPFGFTAYYPGPGIGGHCIPIDPFYLTWKAHEYGLHTRFIELAGEINEAMPNYVIEKIIQALNNKAKAIKGAKILILGIAYKRDVDDVRESPSVTVMEMLQEWGANIQYSDPHVPTFPQMREHHFDLQSVDVTAETITEFDAVILLTDHSDFDYQLINQHAQILIDTRGRFTPDSTRIYRA